MKIEKLLQDVKISLNKLKNQQKPSENFNIFSTLGVEVLETRHSKFLAELLNPNGTHGCKDLFLKEFLEFDQIKNKIQDIETFCKAVKVETEQFHIVEKNQSYIDIVLETQDTTIVIENKIYATDQPKQLYRYHKAKNSENFKNIIIVYLTLDGKSPSEQSLNKQLTHEEIELLSYEMHITNWLGAIIDNIEFDNIKNIVKQYLSTIEQLTNKNSKEENKLIADILKKEDNLQTAIKIANALPRAKANFEIEFYKKLQEQLTTGLIDFKSYGAISDVDKIINLRKPNAKFNHDGFNGLYFYKELVNSKYLFLKIGEDKQYQIYCECFLSSKNDNLKIQRIRKTDFKETEWFVHDNYTIVIAGEELPDASFKTDIIYEKSNDEIKEIITEITEKLTGIIESDEFKELESILEKQ